MNKTPLFLACENGHTQVVKALLAAGAHLNIPCSNGSTPLSIAQEKGFPAIVELLKAEEL